MAAKIAAVWDELVLALQGIDGTGSYTHTLDSAAVQRVRVGQPMLGPPFITCVFDRAPSRRDVQLNSFRRDLFFTVIGWGLVAADTDTARSEASVNMFDDICRAVETDPTLNGNVYDVNCQGTAFVAFDAESGAQYPVAVVEVEVYLRVTIGA